MGEKISTSEQTGTPEDKLDPEMVRRVYKALIDYFPEGTNYKDIYVSSHASKEVKEKNVWKLLEHIKTLAPETQQDFLKQLFPRKETSAKTDDDDIFSLDWENNH